MESGLLEKSNDGTLLYSNTENKLKEILQTFVKYKEDLAEFRNTKKKSEDRKTIQKKLNETIFDEEYVDDKVNEISMNYVSKFGGLNQSKM